MKKKILILVFIITSSLSPITHKNQEESLKIMSFNVRRDSTEQLPDHRWNARRHNAIELISSEKPDILNLQEPIRTQIGDITHGLEKKFPNLYAWTGEPRGARWGFFDTNEYNPIFYNQKKFELIKSGTYWINEPFYIWHLITGYYKETGLLNRIATWAQFKIKKTGQTFYVFNTHFDNTYEKARAHNMKNLLNGMKKEVNGYESKTIILTGDFNTRAPETFNTELTSAGFKNAKKLTSKVSGPENTGSEFSLDKTKPIDHIFLHNGQPTMTVLEYKAIKDTTISSDHFPVMVQLRIL